MSAAALGCSSCHRNVPGFRRHPDGTASCQRCARQADSLAEMAENTARAAAVVAGIAPEVPGDVAVVLIERVTPRRHHRAQLAEALEADPECLTRGGSTAPWMVDHLIAELTAAGATRVRPQCCAWCATTKWVSLWRDGRRICTTCDQRLRVERCGRCGQDRPVCTRDPDGSSICASCRMLDPARFEACSECGTVSAVRRRTPGGPVCDHCARRPRGTCSSCGRQATIVSGLRRDQPRCGRCTPRGQRPCDRCGRTMRIVEVWPTGTACTSCYYKVLDAKSICEGCGARRRIDPRNRDGRDLCSDCAGLAAWFVCRDCGDEARLPADGRCRHCQLIARLADVFGDADGASKELSSLRLALATTERPRAVLRWLAGGHTRQVLAGLVSGQLALTHEALDALGNSKALDHLRQVLVATAALPGRDEELARLEAWIDVTVAAVDNDEDRRLVEAFARWWILRRHRQRAARKGESGSTTHARTKILAAVRLLAWLRGHERALATCCQPDLDLWVVSGPAGRTHAADFVKWAVRQRQAKPGLRIVRRPDAMPGRTVEVDQQLRRARRLLTDDSLELRDRVAGLFVVASRDVVEVGR